MSCYHPVNVKVPLGGAVGRPVLSPMDVPCGRCLGCRATQARDWSVRIMHERECHDSAWFLTLTYDDERIPENGSLCAQDLQKFFKAVRRDEKVSYYACGEYGERNERPHYHAVLFGADFLDKYSHLNRRGRDVWRSPALESYWDHGISEFGTVTAASAAYVAGYVRKKVSKKVFPDHYNRVDPVTGELVELEPEFSRMSLKPAIGRRWIEKYWADVYPRDFVLIDGKEFKPPRYYDKWMMENHPEIMIDVKERRYDAIEEVSNYTMAAREAIHQSRVDLFQGRGKV